MDRFKRMLVAAVAAFAVCVVAAGPAEAAKGGNNDNAHACQQGGHETLVAAENPQVPFKNTGDCVSHGAQGGASSSLQLLNSTYPCGGSQTGTCWGIVSGSGLQGPWFVADADTGDAFVFGEANGNLSQLLEQPCAAVPGFTHIQASARTSAGAQIRSTVVDKPTPCS
jgi:hypothetical protein